MATQLGPQNQPTSDKNQSWNPASLFIFIFRRLEASGVTFWEHFGFILEVFLGPLAGKMDFWEIVKIAVSPRRESNFQGSSAVEKHQKRHPKAASEATSVPRGPGRPARLDFPGKVRGHRVLL